MKKNQEETERINLVLRAIRNVYQLLVRERNRDKLLKGICQQLVKNRGYYNTWIAIFDEEKELVTSAQAGLVKNFLPLMKLLKRGELTDCAQTALSQPNIVITEDPTSTCTDCPLASNYQGRGAMTIRLEYQKRIYGILCVSTPKYFVADKEEKSLLEEVAGDIAFTLYSVELKEEHKQADEVLRESDRRYRSVFENTGTATFIIEEDMIISMVNTEFEKLSGYSKEEVEGKMKWTEFVVKKDQDRMKEYHVKRRQNEAAAPTEYEFRFIDKSGNIKNIFCKIGMISGTKRNVASWMDITSLKQAEVALRQAEIRYRSLFNNMHNGVAIYKAINKGENFIFVDLNRAGEKIENAKQESLIGKKVTDVFPGIERFGLFDVFKRVWKSGKPEYHPVSIYKDERIMGWRENFVYKLPSGEIVAVYSDETKRKQAEMALRESEKRFRDLVESSPIGISIIQDGRVVYRNPEQKRLVLDLPAKSSLLESENIHPEDIEKVRELYRSITSGKVRTMETDFRFYPPDKKNNKRDMKWVTCRTSIIEYQGKEAIVVNMVDITRAKELEHLLVIQDKMSSLGRVAAGIAHEIRNPLTGINMYLDVLKKMYDKPESIEESKQIFEQIQSASNRIEAIIRRVMDFSKPSEPKFVLKDINQPIEEAIKLSSLTLRKREIKIGKKLRKDLPLCRIDSPLIEEVILNLINNAVKAMKDMDGTKEIEITSSRENNLILLRIADSGPGIPLHLREKIFEPFFTTKNDTTGIGLSLVHRIVTDHSGSIDIKTSKWGGAEFKIKIPIKKD